MLVVNNIEVVYHNVILVLRGVSLKLEDGQIITVIGSNGAGKTTTLKAISGVVKTEVGKVSRGSIEFDGRRIDTLGPEEIAALGIIQVWEGRRVLEHLTVQDELESAAWVRRNRGDYKNDIERVYSYFPRLKELRHKTSGYLSGGEQQMLVIGRGLMAIPKIMLLDEPSMGLSPILVHEIFDIVKNINAQEHTSILLVEQNAKAALELAEYGYVMENGRVVLDGPAGSLKENEDVKEFYLGLSALDKSKSYREVKHYKRRKRWLG